MDLTYGNIVFLYFLAIKKKQRQSALLQLYEQPLKQPPICFFFFKSHMTFYFLSITFSWCHSEDTSTCSSIVIFFIYFFPLHLDFCGIFYKLNRCFCSQKNFALYYCLIAILYRLYLNSVSIILIKLFIWKCV